MNYLQKQNLVRKQVLDKGANAFEKTNAYITRVTLLDAETQRKLITAASSNSGEAPDIPFDPGEP